MRPETPAPTCRICGKVITPENQTSDAVGRPMHENCRETDARADHRTNIVPEKKTPNQLAVPFTYLRRLGIPDQNPAPETISDQVRGEDEEQTGNAQANGYTEQEKARK